MSLQIISLKSIRFLNNQVLNLSFIHQHVKEKYAPFPIRCLSLFLLKLFVLLIFSSGGGAPRDSDEAIVSAL